MCLPVSAGQKASDFDWPTYLDSCASQAASPSLFTSRSAVGATGEPVDTHSVRPSDRASVSDL